MGPHPWGGGGHWLPTMQGRGLGQSAPRVRRLLELICLETTEGVSQASHEVRGSREAGWPCG